MTPEEALYQAIALAIYEVAALDAFDDARPAEILGFVRDRLSNVLAAGNQRFDRSRFTEACSTGQCKPPVTPEEARKRLPCIHKRCDFRACSAQVECYCGHAKEQHRIGGRHGCEECGCVAFSPVPAETAR